jgi:hypothetical protein
LLHFSRASYSVDVRSPNARDKVEAGIIRLLRRKRRQELVHPIGVRALVEVQGNAELISGIDGFPHTFSGVDLPPLEFNLIEPGRFVFEVFP